MRNKNLIRKFECMVLLLLIFCISHLLAEPCGDVNSDGSINIVDALLIAQYYVGLNPSDFDQNASDVNADSSINIVDALLIAQYYVGLITELPGCEQTPDPTDPPQLVDCSEAPVWSPDEIYNTAGMRVQYNGYLYENNWYTQNQNPEQNSGANEVWTLIGQCDSEITPVPATPSPTPSPTPDSTSDPNDTPAPTSVPGDIAVPDGYAASAGTTGGGNASSQTVSSASAFKSAVSGDSSKVIIVNGRFNLGGNVTIGSNTTIKGANSSSGLYGGSVFLPGTNYIIQNMTFGPTNEDVMEASGGTKIFIHKCTFHDSTDELFSIKREADYVTVSWCRFYFDSPDNHSFGNLIGHSDDHTADRGKLHVTMHHNWYDNGVKGRQPRVRFGYVHIYNNYYSSNNADYCIGAGYECHVRVENSHFDNVDDPWADYGAPGSGGQIGWSNLKFEGCSQPTFMSNSFPVFSPPYSFSMDSVDNVESIVRNGAGNR